MLGAFHGQNATLPTGVILSSSRKIISGFVYRDQLLFPKARQGIYAEMESVCNQKPYKSRSKNFFIG